ncbi:Response regulator PleD [compost metagenome]
MIGLLYLDRQSINRTFDEADLRLVEGLAGFAALAIANATRFEETQDRNKLLATAQALAALCSPRVTPERLRREIAWQGLVLADAETAALYGEATEPLVCLDARGRAISCQAPLEALANARLTGVASTTSDERLTTLLLPLMADHRCWGILCLSRPATRLFTPQAIATLEGTGAQMAHLLEARISREAQAQRIERLEKAMGQLDDRHDASKLDPQSGLFSAPYVMQCLRDEVTEALRYDQPLSLLVLAAARIEALAIRFGPQTGDDMWRHLGDALAQMSRKTDVAARLEGEHCAILMPQTPLAGAEVFARRLKDHLDEFAICDANGAELWKLDVAVATIQWQLAETPDEMLARALGALQGEG